MVHCLGSLCGCPAPPQSSNNTHHAHISTPPPACTPFFPLPARSPHTREPTRQINRQLATASYAFANGIWLPGKGYINNTARNRRPPVEGEGEVGGEDGVAEPASACENPTLLRPVRLSHRLPVWLSVCHSQTGRRQPQQMGQGVPYNSYKGLELEKGVCASVCARNVARRMKFASRRRRRWRRRCLAAVCCQSRPQPQGGLLDSPLACAFVLAFLIFIPFGK